jgi:CHC2 zinc finger
MNFAHGHADDPAAPRRGAGARAGAGAPGSATRREAAMIALPNALDAIDFGAVYEYLSGFSLATARKATARDLAVICPLHSDTHPSMNLDVAGKKWYCPVCQIGGGVADLVSAVDPIGYAGGSTLTQRRSAAFAWLRSRNFAREDLRAMPQPGVRVRSGFKRLRDERCTPFDYVDARGNLIYQVLRFDGLDEDGRREKYFRQRRRLPDGAWHLREESWEFRTDAGAIAASLSVWKDHARTTKRRRPSGPWLYSLEGVDPLLLDLPTVLRAAARGEVIVLVEGEKKALLLRARTGLCVTTSSNGAGGHRNPAWLQQVAGASALWSLADSDKIITRPDAATGFLERLCPGRDAALDRAHFFRRTVFDVRVIDFFPQRFDGSDVEQWLELRPDASPHALRTELAALAAAAPAIG